MFSEIKKNNNNQRFFFNNLVCVVFAAVPVPVGVGMESGFIPDNQLTSSSNQGPEYGAQYSRLNLRLGAGAWCAGSCDSSEYLQIDLSQVYLIHEVNGHKY